MNAHLRDGQNEQRDSERCPSLGPYLPGRGDREQGGECGPQQEPPTSRRAGISGAALASDVLADARARGVIDSLRVRCDSAFMGNSSGSVSARETLLRIATR